jgi:outer membrane protein TolC
MTPLLALTLAVAPLTLDQALARVDEAADVTAADAAATERRDAVKQLPALTSNPTVLLQPGLRAESGAVRPEGQLSVTQGFNVAGLAQARHDVAEHDAVQARALALERRWQRRVQVARAWLDAWAANAATRAAQEDVDHARELVTRLGRAEASGGVTKADLASARAFAAEAEAFLLAWEGRSVDAGAALSMLLGLDELAVVGDAAPELPTMSVEGLTARVPPHVRLLDAQLAAASSRALEAAAQWGTQLQVSVSGAHEAPTAWLAGVGVGVTLPLFERGQADVAMQRALATRLTGELDLARRRARIEVKLLAHELEHTREIDEVVNGQQLPQAIEAARLEGRRFDQGETTLQELLLVRRVVLTARAAAVVARADLLAARLKARELADVVGGAP